MIHTITSRTLSDIVQRGLRYVEEEQLPNGEIPNYRKLSNGSWEYSFSPLPAAYIHDALSCFDALSLWFDPRALDVISAGSRKSFLHTIMSLRRRLLRFLAWQQSADLSWRFFGHGSTLPADPDLTVSAATTFVEVRGRDRALDWTNQTHCIRSLFREMANTPNSRGTDVAETVATRHIAIANAFRYNALLGESTEEIEATLLDILSGKREPSREPDRIAFLWAIMRAGRQGGVTLGNPVYDLILNELLEYHDARGNFGGPLSSALALHALLDLGYEGKTFTHGYGALLSWLDPVHGRRFEAFCHDGCGSSAWTTAAIITALARTGGRVDA